jgi:hypothetical protein
MRFFFIVPTGTGWRRQGCGASGKIERYLACGFAGRGFEKLRT